MLPRRPVIFFNDMESIEPLRWGIVGPGAIARKFAQDAQAVPGCVLESVAGRDAARAEAFARECGTRRFHASPLAMAEDAAIDAVYVATPHHNHFDTAMLMLSHGKAVLVEKPITVSAAEASRLVETARIKGVFLMEAMWTRFLPMFDEVRRWLDDGAIGRLRMVSSGFCVRGNQDPTLRWLDPAKAGGSLLDLGVYCLSMQQFATGAAPLSTSPQALVASTGVDELLTVAMRYPDGVLGQFTCGLAAHGDTSLTIAGEAGRIHVPHSFFSAQRATILCGNHPREIERPFIAGGFEYQIAEVCRCIRRGAIESNKMPLRETLDTMRTMDLIRSQIGLVYPWERARHVAG
jgi:predicted dehydrogenase